MSRLYDTVEPTVIDDVMLKSTIIEQGPQEEAGNVARKDGIFYEEVPSLRLDFKSDLSHFYPVLVLYFCLIAVMFLNRYFKN